MSSVAALTAIFDHLHDTGLVDEDAWLTLRAQAQARAVDVPDQSDAEQAAAWARGSLPHHEYRSARLHLDLKAALSATTPDDVTQQLRDIDADLRARVELYETEQIAALQAGLDLSGA